MKQFNVAVVGATGLVGETMQRVLEERRFPVKEFFPIASHRSAGQTLRFQNDTYDVLDIEKFDFKDVDIALFSAGGDVSRQYAPIAAKAGAVVIDNSSAFRYEADIPLVVTEVNPQRIAQYKNRGIIANPNCSTMQMLVALKPLHDHIKISRINVATYQAVSGTGRRAISELVHQTGELLNGRPAVSKVYPVQIAFNILPHIDEFQDNGYTKEEMKMVWETQKILEDDSILVNPTAVRVPALYGHSEAVHVEFTQPFTVDSAKKILSKAPGVQLIDSKKEPYPTILTHAAGHDEVFVGRIRQDISHPCGLNLWIVADNIRKGAATNAVQIAEILSSDYL